MTEEEPAPTTPLVQRTERRPVATLQSLAPDAEGMPHGGEEVRLVVDGARAFAVSGRTLATIDLAEPLHPRVAARVSLTRTGAEAAEGVAEEFGALALDGDSLYVAEYSGVVHVFDVSDLAGPRALRRLPMPFPASQSGRDYLVRDILVADGSLFLGGDDLIEDRGGWQTGRGRVVEIDVRDPTAPALSGAYDTNWPVSALASYRGWLVVATDRQNGVTVGNPHETSGSKVAIHKRGEPALPALAEYVLEGSVTELATRGDWIYVLGFDFDDPPAGFGLLALTAEDPPIFRELSSLTLPTDPGTELANFHSAVACCQARATQAASDDGELRPAPICTPTAHLQAWDMRTSGDRLLIAETYYDESGMSK